MSCPICDEMAHKKYRPFCSKKCADIDLGKWLSGTYALPGERPEDIENAQEEVLEAQQIKH